MSDISTLQIAQQVADELIRIDGVTAVVLGGSRGRGDAHADSDVDLGIYYDPDQPPSLDTLRDLAARLDNRHNDSLVTHFGAWGPWINGGGWLQIEGVPVDWLYRDYNKVEEIIHECRAGNPQVFYQVGHPHGFWTPIYMGEVHLCQPLADPDGVVMRLKQLTTPYPVALKKAMVERNLWEAGFALDTSRKSAKRGDVLHVSGNLFRCGICLLQVLFALNETYCINEKGALKQTANFAICPPDFAATISTVLGNIGDNGITLTDSIEKLAQVVEEVRELVVL